jgi:hypothetical protein
MSELTLETVPMCLLNRVKIPVSQTSWAASGRGTVIVAGRSTRSLGITEMGGEIWYRNVD